MEGLDYLRELAIILVSAKFFGLVARKLKAPQVVGEILAGLIIGPCVLNVVQATDFVNKIAEIGVILLMFEAGLGTNLDKLKKTGAKATVIALSGVIVPLALGTFAFLAFYGFAPYGSNEFFKALFIGTIMTATSVSITVAALSELGKLSSTVGTTITSAAIIDDVIGIIVLTIVLGMKSGSSNTGAIILKVFLFFVFAGIVGYVVYKLFKVLEKRYATKRRLSIFALCFCFAMAYIAERYFGIADITGAYIAGVIICNLDESKFIERRVDVSSYMIFGPVFFASIGLKTTFDAAGGGKFLWFCLVFVLTALIGKVAGCGLCARACKVNRSDSLKIGVGMMTRGEVALITAQKGLAVGMMSSDFFSAVILLIIISSVITPIVLKTLYKKDEEKKAVALNS